MKIQRIADINFYIDNIVFFCLSDYFFVILQIYFSTSLNNETT